MGNSKTEVSIHHASTVVDTSRVFALCEAGRYREAGELLSELDPSEHPLAFGMVETARGNQELAKDYLGRCGGDVALTQLALAYWRSGEVKEARDILDTLPESFDRLLSEAIIETEIDAKKAISILEQAARYEVSAGLQARLHNQRAMALRRLGETDRAIREYDHAIHYFTEAKSDCLPLVVNNLAGIYLDCGCYAEAHCCVDQSIELLGGDPSHLAKAYDQKALTYLAEGKLDQARNYANRAVSAIEKTDKQGWLAEFLITRSKILHSAGEVGSALIALDRVSAIGEYLNNDQVLYDAATLRNGIAKALTRNSDIERIALALQIAGSLRGAARKLGVSVQLLIKIMDRYGMDRPRRLK